MYGFRGWYGLHMVSGFGCMPGVGFFQKSDFLANDERSAMATNNRENAWKMQRR